MKPAGEHRPRATAQRLGIPSLQMVHADAMQLHYLLFDFSDEESGHGSFDAMATVAPERLPALLAEVSAALRWAHGIFGPAGGPGEEGEWDFDLQAVAETALKVRIDEDRGVSISPTASAALTTVMLTLSGSAAFCEAFRVKV